MVSRHRLSLIRFGSFFVFTCFVIYYSGLSEILFEESFDNFSYPFEGDFFDQCFLIRQNFEPEVAPINNQTFSIRHNNERKCSGEVHMIIVVKSKINHIARRAAIRNSWGSNGGFRGVEIRTIFTLGIDKKTHDQLESSDQILVDLEAKTFNDVIQFNFIDEYYNNTLKTVSGMKWCNDHCSHSNFFLFVDDDFFVSTKNILRFLENPNNYPESSNLKPMNLHKKLYTGFVFDTSPHRKKYSKWYVPLEEYKYDKWPTYVSAGVFVLSREALIEMYCVSLYTKHFRFDDIFLGIVAYKSNIKPLHSNDFHFYKKRFKGVSSYQNVLASHGYDNSEEMLRVWREMRAKGYA